MTGKPRDPLLGAARLLVGLIMVLLIVATVALAGAAIAAPLFQGELLAKLAEETGRPAGSDVIVMIVAILVLIAIMLALGFVWMRHLRRIIDSVGQGDPFIPDNARRLTAMGWLTVVIEALSIPAGAMVAILTHMVHRTNVDMGLSLGGVLMALVLFILARVFREGARMRDELEGTV